MSQTPINHPGLPTFRTTSALTINIPDPIMEPATTMVASHNPRTGLNFDSVMNFFNSRFEYKERNYKWPMHWARTAAKPKGRNFDQGMFDNARNTCLR